LNLFQWHGFTKPQVCSLLFEKPNGTVHIEHSILQPMYKTLIIIFGIITVFLLSCNGRRNSTSEDNTSITSGTGKNNAINKTILPRDRSISKENAYNDIFLDSTDVEKFIAQAKLNDTVAAAIRSFYNARNFEYSWFNSTGLIEQAFNFHSLCCTDNEKDVFSKSLERRLDKLRIPDDSTIAIDPRDPATIKTELEITQKFIEYAISNYTDNGISAADLGTYIPTKKTAILDLADSVLADSRKNRNYDNLNPSYSLLKEPLRRYVAIAKSNGWQEIPSLKKKYTHGAHSTDIALIKKRLQLTGELSTADTTDVFDADLQNAIKAYQQAHGYKPTGEVTAALIKDLNTPALARVQQILINMQRMRWMPTELKGRLILINIPEFELYVDSASNTLFQMDVVVGAEGHNTTMFSGNLNQVVFSPYWNVPPSIVKKEILPAMERNKHYLEDKDMEITGQEGGLPVIRARPGPKNPLGKVKFLFPNSYSIYLHDTPDKGLFKKMERDASHGCIRLADARKLAIYLLQNSNWTPGKIDEAMNSGHEQFVKLKNTVPVMITYYTAWVDSNKTLHFADDIYDHDSKMAAKMFTTPQ
jgi:L,D-transpeptidase YcbB